MFYFLQPHSPEKAAKFKLRYPVTLHICPLLSKFPFSSTAITLCFRIQSICLDWEGKTSIRKHHWWYLCVAMKTTAKALISQKDRFSTGPRHAVSPTDFNIVFYVLWKMSTQWLECSIYDEKCHTCGLITRNTSEKQVSGEMRSLLQNSSYAYAPLKVVYFSIATKEG